MPKLQRLPIKVIATLSKVCDEKGLNFEDPYNDYYKNEKIVHEASRLVGLTNLDNLEIEFICKFIKNNLEYLKPWFENKTKFADISNSLKLPEEKNFKIYYEVWGGATLTEKYYDTITCYDSNWVKDSVQESRNNDSWNYWDGTYEGYETDNFDADNFDVTDVQELSKGSMNESVSWKKTKSSLDRLDRKTLIELRNLINRKLSS